MNPHHHVRLTVHGREALARSVKLLRCPLPRQSTGLERPPPARLHAQSHRPRSTARRAQTEEWSALVDDFRTLWGIASAGRYGSPSAYAASQNREQTEIIVALKSPLGI